jgi:hypothetical protein
MQPVWPAAFNSKIILRSIFLQLFYKEISTFYLTPLHHVNCVQKWVILFYAVLLWFDSLMMAPCGPKHVEKFSMIFEYEYVKKNFVYFVGLVICDSYPALFFQPEDEGIRLSENLGPINETMYKRFKVKRAVLMKIQAF